MRQNQKMEDKIMELLIRDDAKEPDMVELGGDYYFRCPWLVCGRTLHRDMQFCPGCGQRILWRA
jgi:hypothetical protein